MIKTLLCCPWYFNKVWFEKSLKCLDPYKIGERLYKLDNHLISVATSEHVYIYLSRNIFITGKDKFSFKKPPILCYDQWVQADSDEEWNLEQLRFVLDSDKAICGIGYRCNSVDPKFCATRNGKHLPLTETGFKKVDGMGCGFFKAKRTVFETMEPYWFWPREKVEEGILDSDSEDIEFFKNAKKAGFQAWCRFDNPVIHHNPQLEKRKEHMPEGPNTQKTMKIEDFIDQQIEANTAQINALMTVKKVVVGMRETIEQLKAQNLPTSVPKTNKIPKAPKKAVKKRVAQGRGKS